MNGKEKVTVLRSALLVVTETKTIREFLTANDPKALEQARKAIEATAPRAAMTPEQREVHRKAYRFNKRLERLVSWLKLDGVKKGNAGFRKSDNAKLKFISDPRALEGGVAIDVEFPGGTTSTVDALTVRPDFTAVEPKQAKEDRKVRGTLAQQLVAPSVVKGVTSKK